LPASNCRIAASALLASCMPARPGDADAGMTARAEVRAFVAEVARTFGKPIGINGDEHCATTVRELGVLVEHVKRQSSSWVGRRVDADCSWREVSGLEPKDVNLYDVNENLLKPLGAKLGVAYSELFARGQKREPKVFVSHAWLHPLLLTDEALKQHAEDRGYGEDEPIWICAFVIRQHAVNIDAIIDSPFFKVLKAREMTVS